MQRMAENRVRPRLLGSGFATLIIVALFLAIAAAIASTI